MTATKTRQTRLRRNQNEKKERNMKYMNSINGKMRTTKRGE